MKREEGNKEELVDLKDVKPKGRTLIVMGTYSIGKERIVKGKLTPLVGGEIEDGNSCGSRTRLEDLLRSPKEGHTLMRDRSRFAFHAEL